MFAWAMIGCILTGCDNIAGARHVVLATTTSTVETGLMDTLRADFEARSGIRLQIISVGSGAALELGRRGEADVLLVHSPAAEEEFMRRGYGSNRRPVMFNDFIIVGPENDPARITGEIGVVAALRRLADQGAAWVSRDDGSGTDALDNALWRAAGVHPVADAYVRSGQGMAATLRLADEIGAYTLSDRGTYIASRAYASNKIVFEHDPMLINQYHVIAVRADRFDAGRIQKTEAAALIDFFDMAQTQRRIGSFGVSSFGEPLFRPGRYSP